MSSTRLLLHNIPASWSQEDMREKFKEFKGFLDFRLVYTQNDK